MSGEETPIPDSAWDDDEQAGPNPPAIRQTRPSDLPAVSGARAVNGLDPETKIKHKGMVQDQKLRLGYAIVLLLGMTVQVGIADWVFVRYANGIDWQLPTEAIAAWLGATVIEVIGLVLVITRSLFPKGSDES